MKKENRAKNRSSVRLLGDRGDGPHLQVLLRQQIGLRMSQEAAVENSEVLITGSPHLVGALVHAARQDQSGANR